MLMEQCLYKSWSRLEDVQASHCDTYKESESKNQNQKDQRPLTELAQKDPCPH